MCKQLLQFFLIISPAISFAQTKSDSLKASRDTTRQLQTVEVTGRKDNSYKNERSFSATKIEMAVKDVPQAISTVTKELMQDQQAFRMGDIVKNVSGVNQFSGYDDFTLRGFRSTTQLLNGLRTVTGFWSMPLLVNIERVEVIKGPAAALFGNTDPGGTINSVTKKPLDVNRKVFGFSVGSFQTYRGTIDLTGPLNEEKTVLYRLNLGYENSETFKTNMGTENLVISPSLSFAPTNKTRVNLDLVYSMSNGKLYRGQPIFGAEAGTQLNSTPISFTIGKANDFLKEKNVSANISLSHQFSQNFSFNVSYLKYQWNENLMEHRTSNGYAVDSAGRQIPTLMQMMTIRRLSKKYNDNMTAYFVSRFSTGALEHHLLVGYDFNQFSVPVGGSSETSKEGYRLKNGTVGNYVKANKENFILDANGNPVPNVPHFNLLNPDYSIATTSGYITTSTATAPARNMAHGIYLQDNIRWNKFSLLIGLRKEFYKDKFNYSKPAEKQVEQNSFIPRIGLVYNLTPDINVYGIYVQGFMPQTSSTMVNPNVGGPFDPLTSRMYEVGAKGDFLNRKLGATVALYHLEQNNVLVNANDPNNPERLEQRGQERGRGVEVDVNGRILDNLSISANYTFSETVITRSADPKMAGRLKENAPRQQGGLWVKYAFRNGQLKGLGAAAGGSFVTQRRTFSEILELPGYAVANAALYYHFDKIQLAVNINNILDKTHWIGGYDYNRLFPGAPRNIQATIYYTL
ncbi:TonB-dependent siderophore receptor [Chitinophaga niabensis]|uniref:TonB-dependent siderophore receptor n=1 Tax=Chitinophaga niabensis TaxID=536979 RepID=UPI0031BB73C2